MDLSEKSLLYKIKLALGMMCIAKMFSQTNCDWLSVFWLCETQYPSTANSDNLLI